MRKIIKKPIKVKKISKISKSVEEALQKNVVTPKEIDKDRLVPTGSTTFNLECSGCVEGAFQMGTMVNLIGDSHAGKTLFALTIFAECSLLEMFDDYRFIYRDIERANEFDLNYLFGNHVAERIECDEEDNLRTFEEFNDDIHRACADERPCIYVIDSFDALTTEAALKLDASNRVKREKGNKTDGSYGDGKAKLMSEAGSKRIPELGATDSLLIIISQTRDNIGFGAMFTPKTRSGGKALKFYAFHEIWLAMQKKEKTGKRTIVTNVQAKITKNKLIGRHGEAYFPVLFDYGVDNISSCINFLVDEGEWTGTKGAINTKGFIAPKVVKNKKKHRSKSEIVAYIEDNDLEDDLFQLCQETYDAVMEKLKPKRKRKY